MQYLLLIYNTEQNCFSLPDAEREALSAEYMTFTQAIAKSGHYKGGNALQPTSTATTVRVRNGKRSTTDGPFAETREQLGGFFLIDAPSLDEALAIAARLPMAQWGTIEVRPLVEMTGLPATSG